MASIADQVNKTPIIRDSDFEVSVLTLSEYNSVFDFVQTFFTTRETLTVKCNISAETLSSFARNYCKDCIEDGMSCVVYHKATKKTAGICLTKLLTRKSNEGFDYAHENKEEQALIHMLNDIELQLDVFEDETVDKVQDFFAITCDPQFKGKGIPYMLIEKCEELGKEKGCQLAYSQSTGPASQHIRTKCGYSCKKKVYYNSLNFEGKPLYEGKDDEGPFIGLFIKDYRKI